jgi:hypothetical protein
MKNISVENIINTQIKSSQLADLLCMIVDLKGTATNALNDDPVIVLARNLAIQVTDLLWEDVKDFSAKEVVGHEIKN